MNEDNANKKIFFSQDGGYSPLYQSEDVTDVYDADDGDKKYVYGHQFVQNLIPCKLTVL